MVQLPTTPPRRSPRRPVSHRPVPLRSPTRQPARRARSAGPAAEPPVPPARAERPRGPSMIDSYSFDRSTCRNIEITRLQCGALYFRTVPEQFSPFVNPFVNDAMWSFSPRNGVARTSTLGRKIGDVHFSFVPGTPEATLYVCVHRNRDRLEWVVAERGFQHPLYPTHVLYQRGRSTPRWILVRTFRAYVHMYGLPVG
ncbi:hypothetical protein FRC08_014826 [Ceratobasidium sp. 394]|nr:hypothetical protein FRC08_014826 [Ceratobasidium sp. 394]